MDIVAGDLIFACIGPMTDAISIVTRGYRGGLMNHVGVAVENQKGLFVLEAFPPEVRVTNWDVYARRTEFPPASGRRRFMVGRLQPNFSPLIPPAIAYGLTLRDTPYDELYLTGLDALYCSELVVDMFARANGGQKFFVENPMSFKDPATGKILQTWVEYYAHFGLPVPEGEPGSNPADLSLDPRLDIIEIEGAIPGLN